jgi:hypothetical protein
MNATEEMVARYAEELHKTLSDVSARFFSAAQSKQLLHNSLLPATITCYVSTQFGVGFEYSRADSTTIKTARGSARIEDLIVQAPSRLQGVGPMFNIGGANSGISGVTLEGGFPFRLIREDASVALSDIRFSSEPLGWSREIQYAEVYGDRRAQRWGTEAAQNRAKDEILAALYLSQRAQQKSQELDEYVASFKKKSVLLLGAYDEAGGERLRSISKSLEELDYEPILVKDIPEFEHYDLPQKVVVIGALARFIVIDDSGASGHLNEFELCRTNRWVTLVLRAEGHQATWMTAGASISSNVIREMTYDISNPKQALEEGTKWAEERLIEIKAKLNEIYPWRFTS